MARKYHPDFRSTVVARGSDQDPLVLEAIVRKAGDGSLFFIWTGGGDREPFHANVTKCSRSTDGGTTWSAEQILFAHPKKGVFTPALYAEGDMLYAFPNSYYDDTTFCQEVQSYISESRDCGKSFCIPYSFPGALNGLHAKCTLKIGNRLFLACSWYELHGEHWASFEGANKPCVVSGRTMSDPDCWFKSHTEYCGVLISDDGGKTFRLCGHIGRKGIHLVEPMMTVLSDGTLVMLIRIAEEHRLYESRSYDNGETWSEAVPTDIPSAITKVLLLRDSAGRIYLVHNPTEGFHRSPLALWISDDDMRSFGTKIILAEDEEAPLCYPDGFLDEERGMLCLSWDDRKAVYYSEFPIPKQN